MKNTSRFGIASILVGAALALAITVGPSAMAVADNSQGETGTVALPPGGAAAIYPQDSVVGGANPYTPFGPDPCVPYGVWAQRDATCPG
jgi:hypothetical protein